jgi:teichuronic acid biosynthesis glycosyltransferase TuaC
VTDVAWLTSAYPWSSDQVSGIFFRSQVQALARAGLDVTVVAPVPAVPWPLPYIRQRWREHAQTPRAQQDGAVMVLRPRFPNIPGQPGWARPDRFIADAAWRDRGHWEGARLIHGHYSLVGLAAWRLARRSGLPFALTFHGSDLNTWPQRHEDRIDDLRTAVREAAAVFVVSEALGERLHDLTGVDATHLPIGSDHRAIEATVLPRPEARRVLDLPADRFVVLFVGSLVRGKGVHELVAAVSSLGDPFLAVLVGSGPEAGLGADDPRSTGRLIYTGARPHDEVIRYMAAADVLVLPSYGEGLPTVLVEAGSVGLPIIASDVGGIPALLADGRGTVLPEVTDQAIAVALAHSLSQPGVGRDQAARLREHVLAHYDIDRNAAELITRYRAIGGSEIAAHAPEAAATTDD